MSRLPKIQVSNPKKTMSNKKNRQIKNRQRTARSDATVGSMQKKIEAMFNLPKDSVRLSTGKKRKTRTDMLVGTLRRAFGLDD